MLNCFISLFNIKSICSLKVNLINGGFTSEKAIGAELWGIIVRLDNVGEYVSLDILLSFIKGRFIPKVL